MQLFGLNISVSRIKQKALSGLSSLAGWWRVFDTHPGAWQQHVEVNESTVSKNWAVFSCITLISGDIAKMPARVMQYNNATRVYDVTLLRPVLRKPNHFQTRIEFIKMWVFSLLLNGNTYVLKERDEDGRIVALYILDPCRVTPLVAPDGSIFYQLASDNLTGIEQQVVAPASEIIHDRINTLFHPLIGLSPIYACGVAAMQGAAIIDNSAKFFENMSRPSGVLVAPGAISPETALALKTKWDENFKGGNIGKVAVLGDGLKYEAMAINAEDSQLIEQLKLSGETICATFHVPAYKLGLGQMPTVNNVAALNQQYYDQALQPITENMELRLEDGLELLFPFEVWMDESVLLRMDPATRLKSHSDSINGGFLAPNEARRDENLPPVPGGDSPMMQQQNYSLIALQRRDEKDAEGTANVQAEAMNGAQVTSLQGLITAAANGEIPVDTARAAIAAAFPLLTPEQIDAMIKPLADFEPEVPEPPTIDNPPPTDDADGDDEEDDDEFAKRFAIDLIKEFEDAEAA